MSLSEHDDYRSWEEKLLKNFIDNLGSCPKKGQGVNWFGRGPNFIPFSGFLNLVERDDIAAPAKSVAAVKKDRDGSDEGTQVGHSQPQQVNVHHPLR